MRMRLYPLFLIIACFLTVNLSACNDQRLASNNSPTSSPGVDTNSRPAANVYPEAAVKFFMNSCTKNKGAKAEAVCSCSINKIQDKYSFEQFRQMIKDAKASGEKPKELRDIVKSCVAQ